MNYYLNKDILLSLFFILFSLKSSSQVIEWQNTIGGSQDESLFSIEIATDGNQILGGFSGSNISGDKNENSRGLTDYWIVKTENNTGNILWQKTIGGNNLDRATNTKETSDGGYIIGGYSNSNNSGEKSENSRGGDDYWVVKLDSERNIIWDKTYGGSGLDRLWSIIETEDGGYILGGESNSNISGEKSENSRGLNDVWIIKIDANGNIQWQKTYGGNDRDFLKSIVKSGDGGFILGCNSMSNISGEKTEDSRGFGSDYWILKIDASGNIIWQKTIGGDNGDNLKSIQKTSDGNIILGGIASSNISGEKSENSICNSVDIWIVKLDSNGQIIWDKTLGGDSTEWIGDIKETNDNGFIIGAMSFSGISGYKTESSRGNRDYWIIKLDNFGNLKWEKTLGGSDIDQLTTIVQAQDGNYIFGGWSTSNISGDKTENSNGSWDYWVVKLKMNQNNYSSSTFKIINICEGEDIELSTNSGSFFNWSGPNGFTSTDQNPVISNPTQQNSGTYNVSYSDDNLCPQTQIVKVNLVSPPIINSIEDKLACDYNNDGIAIFDLSETHNSIIANNNNIDVTYYYQNGSIIPQTSLNQLQNNSPFQETINVRVSLIDLPNCYNETNFKLITESCSNNDQALVFPDFFTPNNDNENDFWPKKINNNIKSIIIFNRFGKIQKKILLNDIGWNGTYNGKLSPPADYWFIATTNNNTKVKGHFSLIR